MKPFEWKENGSLKCIKQIRKPFALPVLYQERNQDSVFKMFPHDYKCNENRCTTNVVHAWK